ncbi:MAG: hypothetical protein RBT57_07195 [Paludibacter sp.]|jgi:hypothetical protein|nr:hypothetical protein [Paludibacter sp.]
MDDLGDYIYLIAIVIAGLSSLLKKRRKPEEQSGRDENHMPDLDDVLTEDDDDFLPRMDTAPVTTPARNTEVYKPLERKIDQTPLSYETVADYMKLRAKKSVKPSRSNPVYDEVNTTVDLTDLEIELESADDAKRAFVYSEIFNRKY